MSAANAMKLDPTHPASGVVYFPESTPVFGKVLGINILGSGLKACSFNCAYCDLGATQVRLNKLKNEVQFPTPEEIRKDLSTELARIHRDGPPFDRLVISGNGEPTLHPDFPEVIKAIIEVRNTWFPDKPIVLFTNGGNLDQRKVADAANTVDMRIVKIDAGAERTFKTVNDPLSRTNLAKVLSGVRKLKDFCVQSFFVQGTVDNTAQADVDEWLEVIAMLKPKAVYLQGLSRPGAASGLIRCDEDTMYGIASKLDRKVQIKAIVIP